MISTTLILCIALGFLANNCSTKIIPLVCPSAATPNAFDLTVKSACSAKAVPDNITIFEATVEVFKKNLAKYSSTAYKCWKVKTILSAWTSFGQFNFFTKKRTETVFTTANECREMVENLQCNEGRLVGNKFSAMTENTKDYPYTSGWAHNSGYWIDDSFINCFFISGKLYKKFNTEMESSLGSVRHCEYEKEECLLADKAVVMWKVNATSKKEYVTFKKMDGYKWNDQFLTKGKDLGFTWSKKSQKVQVEPGKWGVISDQGLAVFIEETARLFQTKPLGFRAARDLEASALTAARSQAIEFRFAGLMDSLNRDLNAFCKVQHDMQEFDLIHSHAEPSLTARRLLNNSQLHGRLIGNILQVRPCMPVDSFEVKTMSWPHCTSFIPLNYTVQGRTHGGYVDPKTMIIYRNSPLIDCHYMDSVIMRDDQHNTFVYDRRVGTLLHTPSITITPLPMYDSQLGGFADFEMIIHRAYDMYQLGENSGVTANDYFETMQMMDGFLNRLANLENGDPPKDTLKSLFDNLSSLHPFGSFSVNWARFHFLWQNTCCALVTAYVAWIFLMPRAVKKMLDSMIDVGKGRVMKILKRTDDSSIDVTPSAPSADRAPVPPSSFTSMHYMIGGEK